MGAKLLLRQVTTHPGNCGVYHILNMRHAEDGLGFVGATRYNTLIPTTKGNK
jgi:hypothetical protein